MIVDCAVYERGQRLDGDGTLAGAREAAAAPEAFVWVGLLEPTIQEFDAVRREFGLHELAVEDAVKAHQRPKLEIYGDTLFLVLKTACYRGPEEIVEIGEIMVFVGSDFVVSVRHGEGGGLGNVREGLEGRPDLLRGGPAAALHALVDRVVDAYEPVIDGVREDIEEVETEVFSAERTSPVERIYKLRREVLGSTARPTRCVRRSSSLPPPRFRTSASRPGRTSGTSSTTWPGSPSRSRDSESCSRASCRRISHR